VETARLSEQVTEAFSQVAGSAPSIMHRTTGSATR
jgi:hypothetical protein